MYNSLHKTQKFDEEEVAPLTDNGRYIPKARYCCGIFSSRRSCIGTCVLIWFLILAGLGVLGFFLFPRLSLGNVDAIPDPNLLFFNSQGVLISDLSGFISSADGSQNFTAVVPMTIRVTVNSQSYVDYKLDSIQLERLSIANPANPDLTTNGFTGKGGVNNVNIIKSGSTVIGMPVNMTFSAIASLPSLQNNNDLKIVSGACANNGQMRVSYRLRFFSGLANILGLVHPDLPTFSDAVNVSCPSSLNQLLSALKQ